VQLAVLTDLKRREGAGDYPLTTQHIEGFARPAISRAYRELATRGIIELWNAQLCRRGKGRLVQFPADTPDWRLRPRRRAAQP
jgi:hypothetical protein